MIDVIFIILILIYLWLSIKVENWITIYYLGFKTETPVMFLRNPRVYDVARTLLIILFLVLSFYTVFFPWFLCLLIIAIVWALSGKIGRGHAFNKYREILAELAKDEEDEVQRNEYIEATKKTNDVLQEKVTSAMKFGL